MRTCSWVGLIVVWPTKLNRYVPPLSSPSHASESTSSAPIVVVSPDVVRT